MGLLWRNGDRHSAILAVHGHHRQRTHTWQRTLDEFPFGYCHAGTRRLWQKEEWRKVPGQHAQIHARFGKVYAFKQTWDFFFHTCYCDFFLCENFDLKAQLRDASTVSSFISEYVRQTFFNITVYHLSHMFHMGFLSDLGSLGGWWCSWEINKYFLNVIEGQR